MNRDLWSMIRIGALGTGLVAVAAFSIDYYRTGYLANMDEASAAEQAMHEFYTCSIERSIETALGPMSFSERVNHFLETRRGYCVEEHNDLESHL